MRDLVDELLAVWRSGESAGLAVVVETWASAPRPAGAAMLVRADGSVTGSVSGGCVEGAVYQMCQEVAGSGRPQSEIFGVSDDDACAVGLPCGGTIEVFTHRAGFAEVEFLAARMAAGAPAAMLTVVRGPRDHLGHRLVLTADSWEGSWGTEPDTATAVDAGRRLLASGDTGLVSCRLAGADVTVLVTSFVPSPRMLVFGATELAGAVADIGSFLDYRVTVCDARPVFATPQRFPGAGEVVVQWPHRYLEAEAAAGRLDDRTVICVLTHDPKFDVPVLQVALRLPIAYVGAMGSRRTHQDRLRRLREAGLDEGEIARLASPIGLDLGARTPEATAVSIAAEIIALQGGGSGRRLTTTNGPIHQLARSETGFSNR